MSGIPFLLVVLAIVAYAATLLARDLRSGQYPTWEEER